MGFTKSKAHNSKHNYCCYISALPTQRLFSIYTRHSVNCKQMDLKLPNFTPFYNPWNSKVEKTQLDDIISKSPGKQKV